MGSLSGNASVPMVGKNSLTFRKRDIYITKESSTNDTIANVVTRAHVEVLGSGSIVRDNNTVQHYDDLVFGVYMMGRSSRERVASHVSASGATRVAFVELGDNQTMAVVPTSLAPHTPQLGVRHEGNKVVIGQSVTDTVVERAANSGSI
jgi:hypothetical protein